MRREGFGIRLGASLIDGVIMVVLIVVLALAFRGRIMAMAGSSGTGAADPTAAAQTALLVVVIFSAIRFGYSLMEVFFAATPGKMFLGLKIANEDGTKATMNTLFTRWGVKNAGAVIGVLAAVVDMPALQTLSGLAGFVIVVGCFFTLGEGRQGFHDMAAETAVFDTATMTSGFPVVPLTQQ